MPLRCCLLTMCRRGVKPGANTDTLQCLNSSEEPGTCPRGVPTLPLQKKEMRKDEHFLPCKVITGTLLSRNVLLPKLMGKQTSQDKPVPSMPYLQREETLQEGCCCLEGSVCALALSVPFPAFTSKLQSWHRGNLNRMCLLRIQDYREFGAGDNRSWYPWHTGNPHNSSLTLRLQN